MSLNLDLSDVSSCLDQVVHLWQEYQRCDNVLPIAYYWVIQFGCPIAGEFLCFLDEGGVCQAYPKLLFPPLRLMNICVGVLQNKVNTLFFFRLSIHSFIYLHM